MRRRMAARGAWLLCLLAAALAASSLVLRVLNADALVDDAWWPVAFLSFPVVGALVASRRPENAIGWLFCAVGLLNGLWYFARHYATYALVTAPGSLPGGAAMAWSVTWAAWLGWLLLGTYLPLLFPTGRPPSPRWRPVAWATAGQIALVTAASAVKPGPIDGLPSIRNPLGIEAAAGIVDLVQKGIGPVLFLATLAACVASVAVRFRQAAIDERQQLKWLFYATGLVALVLGLNALGPLLHITALGFGKGPRVLWFLAVVAFPAAAGIAIVRHRLFDVDLLINRTLVYGALTTCVVALYAFFVGALSLLFQSSGSPVISLVATGLLAVLFQPLRERLQRGVDRLLYGAREDPYAIISRLGQQLHETSADLQRARERLVTAREEERRRLRRDLHDGVGPTLASLAQRLDLASALVPREPASAVALLDDLKARVKATVGEIRRLAHGLRPPALDELGLVASLRELAADHNQPGRLQIVVDAPDVIPPLPAAVEVAAYRIAAEALTNVARHAQAQRCLVRLAVDGALRLEVLDDGRGLAAACRPGVGLRSMRERAAELGGTCLVEPRPEGGTRVLAHLPLAGLSPFHGKEAAG